MYKNKYYRGNERSSTAKHSLNIKFYQLTTVMDFPSLGGKKNRKKFEIKPKNLKKKKKKLNEVVH